MEKIFRVPKKAFDDFKDFIDNNCDKYYDLGRFPGMGKNGSYAALKVVSSEEELAAAQRYLTKLISRI